MRLEIYEGAKLVAIQDGPLTREEMLECVEIQHYFGRSVRVITDHMEQTKLSHAGRMAEKEG